jgi:hypothetical protein
MASLEKQIRSLTAIWINPVYATMASIPAQIEALIVHAFVNRIPEDFDTEMIREAHKRLQKSNLGGDYP